MSSSLPARDALAEAVERHGAASPEARAAVGRILGAARRAVESQWSRGRHEEACNHWREAASYLHDALGSAHPAVAKALNLQGLCEYRAGALDEAAKTLQRALDSAHGAFRDADSALTAVILDNLGLVRHDTGRLVEAERLHWKALGIFSRRDMPQQRATCAHNLGSLYLEMGRIPEGTAALESALETRRELLDPGDPNLALTMNGLAQARALAGREEEALDLTREALSIYDEAEVSTTDPTRLRLEHNHAVMLRDAGDREAAAAALESLLERQREALGAEHRYTAGTALALAETLIPLGRHDEAQSHIQAALHGYAAAVGTGSSEYGGALRLSAALQLRSDRLREALDALLQAEDIEERIVREVATSGSERQRMVWVASAHVAMSDFVALVMRRYADEPRALERSLDLVLRRKGLSAEVLEAERAARGSDGPVLAALLDELATVRATAAERELAGPGAPGVEAYVAHRRELRELEGRTADLEAAVARALPGPGLSERLDAVSASAVAQALPAGSVLVEYLRMPGRPFAAEPLWPAREARYAAFVLAGESEGVPVAVDLGPAEAIEAAVTTYRESITGRPQSRDVLARPRAGAADAGEAGELLRKLILDPLIKAIGNASTLIVAGDGELATVPLQALPAGSEEHVLHRFEVCHVGTGRDVLDWGREQPEASAGMVLAAPDYDHGVAETGKEGAGFRFLPLAGTHAEAVEVGRRLGVRPLEGAEAAEPVLSGARSPGVLHIATHGFFFSSPLAGPEGGEHGLRIGFIQVGESALGNRLELGIDTAHPYMLGHPTLGQARWETLPSPLLRSGLALAGANCRLAGRSPPWSAGDGLLTALDVMGMDLAGTRLVVLSACDTGLGEIKPGEGVFGLRRAVALAGARTLVMSLWKVPDAATAWLMDQFYSHVRGGVGCAAALREAQREAHRKDPDPFTWGAFICEGDPGPLAA